MRKVISIIILSISINLYGQADKNQSFLEKFEGMWVSDESSFFTVFTHSKTTDDLRVFTFSFISDAPVVEKIVKINGDKVITNVTNTKTGYTTGVIYKILTDTNLMANYTGSNTAVKKSIYRKMNFTNKEGKETDY